MTPQELKNSILQLAIQGKLVEQRPEEGTAEELFEQIQAEKQRLIAEKKIKKGKPLPEITEEEIPFDIPDSWKWYRIGEVFNIINGFTPLKSNPEFWDNGEIPWFTIDDVHRQGRFIYSTAKKISQKALSKSSDRIVPPESVLLCCTASVGEYAFTKIPLTTNQQFNAFVVKPHFSKCVYPLYVYEFARTLKDSLIQKAGKTTFNFLSVGKLSEMLFPLPPLAEQKRIVAKIEELMPLVDRYEEAWTKLEAFNKRFPEDMQKSLLQMAIQGKLVEQRPEEGTGEELFEQIQAEKQRLIKEGKIKKDKPLPEITDDEKPFDIPESWKWVKWGEIVNIVSARRVHQSDWRSTGIPFYRAREIAKLAENGYVDNELFISQELFDEFSKSGVPQAGDLMVTAVGTLGKTYIVKPDDNFYYKDASVICFENYAHILPKYLKYIMHSEMMKNQIKSNSDGTTVATLTMVRTAEYLLPLPPLAEQKRIVAKLEELLPLCERLK